jgi:anti-sigma regulatory factor (Ser/Thr protein kinase)
VVGHGIAAAAVMAQMRTALRAYAIDGHPPGAAVERVNALIWDLGPSTMATLAFGVVDAEAETLELVIAGHPPPLLIAPGGDASYVPLQGAVPLGATPLARYRGAVHPFPTGTTVILYTAGLVETRGQPIGNGLERLRALSAGIVGDLDPLCARLVERMVPAEPADDVVILAARVPPVPDRLSGHWPAEAHVLSEVRHLVRRWLRAQGATDAETAEITVACQEACTNAVEHAYRPGHESFALEADCDAGRVRITIRDTGRWRPPRGTDRGRGLMMMRGLMEHVDVRHTDQGTVVVLERTLRGGAG